MRTSVTIAAMLLAVMSTASPRVSHGAAEQTRIVQLQGKAVGTTRTIPPIETTGTQEGNCFEVELIDVRNAQRIGTATPCFTDVNTTNGGMALTTTIFFNFPEGTVVARNRATLQPLIDDPAEMTHVLGAVPAPLVHNILADFGTDEFQGTPGSVRLSGVVDMSNFKDENEIVFDTIAVVAFVDRDAQIVQVQRLLQQENFYAGAIDGILGPQTRQALRQYQAKHGLPETGDLDEPTRQALGMH